MTIQLPDGRQLSDEALQVLRLRALRGIELGFTGKVLSDILGICQETISRWWTAYCDDGVAALPGCRTGRPLGAGRSLSPDQADHIQRLLADNPTPNHLHLPHALWTRRAVGDLIRQEFPIDLADRTVGQYLRRWGYTPKKPARRSRRQDPAQVRRWLTKTYPAIEELARKEDAEILWTDEVGVDADHHPGRGYAPVGEHATTETPRPHIRVNQIAAISNEGRVRFMTYTGSLNAAVFLVFLERLVDGASRKILLIADNLAAHKTPDVEAWVEARKDKIQLFYLPPYCPERNPVEYLNNDLKGQVNKAGMPDDRPTLRSRLMEFMGALALMPAHIISYFSHPAVQYAQADGN